MAAAGATMETVGFIGLGNMGGPMAANLVKGQHQVTAFDLSAAALDGAVEKGAKKAASAAEAVKGAEVVVTMLPAGKDTLAVWGGGILEAAAPGTLVIDSSTIDVASARAAHKLAGAAQMLSLDAPVSGGVAGAEAGTLTFMVGGSDRAFERAKPILEAMGKTVLHAGGPGHGQAVKICNNMILGVSMIAVSEAFVLAEKLGIDPQKLFDIASKASGQCWAMTTYCPVPGPVPTSPANRDYQAGFTAAMMLKDLKLAQDAAKSSGAKVPIGAAATALYSL
ncbi:MAG: 3-hydroxyisobutyrate dehydrogenase, partial [Gammaproteobacteria bacterium]